MKVKGRLDWVLGSPLLRHEDSQARAHADAGMRVLAAAVSAADEFGGNEALSALLGSYANLAHALGATPEAAAAGLRRVADDLPTLWMVKDQPKGSA